VSEVHAYWEEQSAYEEAPKAEEFLAREAYLYAQVEQILNELGEGAEIVFRERVRVARLSARQNHSYLTTQVINGRLSHSQ
jgi:hypothetical protein